MNTPLSRLVAIGFGLAALGGCANSGIMFGDTTAKPKTVVVTDFVAAPEVDAIDRGFSARMDRNSSNYPILERKRRTLARVNDEIVASIIATLQEAGLDAQPGSEEALTLNDKAAVVSGRLRGGEGANPKKKPVGFGPGHVEAVADMTVSYVAGGSRKRLTAFTAQAKDAGKPPTGKQAAARNAAIAAALTTEKAAPEKLSPDVEAQARRLGRAVGDKVVAYAKEQGWIVAPAAAAAPEEQVKLPPEKPAQKPKPKADKPAT
ncbi:MAG TPA: hypothetical protein VMG39_02080 [Pseudolabrys sp.]|nr:hypothetical protein [Pseudolabrys sp.]